MTSTKTKTNGTLNKQKSSSQKHTHKFKKWRQQKPTHTAHRAHQKIAWNSKKWRTKFNTQIFEMMWKCIWLKSLVNLGRTCLMKERCTTWKTWFWQFLGFQKNGGKTSTFKPLKWCEHAYDWSLLGIWGKLVTWKKGVQLGREKNGALLPKCALVHVTISENELNATCVWTTLHFWNECVYQFPLGNKTKV